MMRIYNAASLLPRSIFTIFLSSTVFFTSLDSNIFAEEENKDSDNPKTSNEESSSTGTNKDKKEPTPPVFHLRDGTRITGFPQIEQITVITPYGKLLVPTRDLIRLRFAKEEDPVIQEHIQIHIANLADEEFEVREESMTKILDLGEPALKPLREALKSDDEEVKSRAQTLISQIEEALEDDYQSDDNDENSTSLSGEDDEIVTLKFTAMGKVLERTFQVKSPYGALSVDRKDIVSIVFQEYIPSNIQLSIPGNYFAAANRWFQTKIPLEKGEEFEIKATGQIFLQNYGYSAGPEGTTRTSNKQFEKFNLGALVARVGKGGKPFLVGKKFKGKTTSAGKLMFATALRKDIVSGSFNVKILLPSKD